MGESLYALSQQYRAVLNLLGEEEVSLEAIYDTLDAIDEPIQAKVESIGDMIRNLESEAAALKEESDRLKERAAAKLKSADTLLKKVETVMTNAEFEKIEGIKHTFAFGISNSLECKDPKLLPRHFLKPQEPKADIAGLKKELVRQYEEQGVKLVNKYSAKPKQQEMLFTELNESLESLGVQFNIKRKLSLKKK